MLTCLKSFSSHLDHTCSRPELSHMHELGGLTDGQSRNAPTTDLHAQPNFQLLDISVRQQTPPPPLLTPAIERLPEDLLLPSHMGASPGSIQVRLPCVRFLNNLRVHNISQRRVGTVRIRCGASVTREEPELSYL